MLKRPPHILITTPESLYILLTAERSRRALATAATVIVDEIHAVAGDKRGAHLALSLERLDALAGRPLQRIGLSATQKPIDEVARLLVGAGRLAPDGAPDCAIVDTGHRRALELVGRDHRPGARADRQPRALGRGLRAHRRPRRASTAPRSSSSTRAAWSSASRTRSASGSATSAWSRTTAACRARIRLAAEERLKSGEVPVVVATASLELGIDVGHVDLVCHLGAPRALATLLQRVGRSGHSLGACRRASSSRSRATSWCRPPRPCARSAPASSTASACPTKPLDILAQQMVAIAAAEDIQRGRRCGSSSAAPIPSAT